MLVLLVSGLLFKIIVSNPVIKLMAIENASVPDSRKLPAWRSELQTVVFEENERTKKNFS